jgi:NAD-dependent dihydropyrimidine dehydrogenase PreA subunit
VARPELCNGCALCVWICPDFALKVSLDENHANRADDTE